MVYAQGKITSDMAIDKQTTTMSASENDATVSIKKAENLEEPKGNEYVCCNARKASASEETQHETRPKQDDFHTYENVNNLPNCEARRTQFGSRQAHQSSNDFTSEEPSLLRAPSKFEGDYECMSSPDSLSNCSSNRSSLRSFFACETFSPDRASLSSIDNRLSFGEGSQRASRASTSSQNSTRSEVNVALLEPNNAATTNQNNSSDKHYENLPITGNELSATAMNSRVIHPQRPPLPRRQKSLGAPEKVDEPEMILPYKIVDLEELQRSLGEDIEPYYTHTGSDSDEENSYSECSEHLITQQVSKRIINTSAAKPKSDLRPTLPPKRRSLGSNLNELVVNGDVVKGKPVPLPRQSVLLDELRQEGRSVTDEEIIMSSYKPITVEGHLSRQLSLPVERVVHSRRQSASPSARRPPRSPPPPPPTSLHNDKSSNPRPVSEMLPRQQSWQTCQPAILKRSNTLSTPTTSPPQKHPTNRYSVQVPLTTTRSPPAQNGPTPPKDDSKLGLLKSNALFSKGKAFKKAFTNLKKPKSNKKELIIGPPTDFANMCQPRTPTAGVADRGLKAVSILEQEEPEEESSSTSLENSEVDTETSEDRLSEDVYRNFPISQSDDNPEEASSPKKPPRSFTCPDLMTHHDGYLQPSKSQWTVEQETGISENKLPELGPLPDTPVSTPDTNHPPTFDPDPEVTTESKGSPKPVVRTKPKVPKRPGIFKPKIQRKPHIIEDKLNVPAQTPDDTIKPVQQLVSKPPDRSATTQRPRSCDTVDEDVPRDSFLTDMHLTVLKDILIRWQNTLRRPKINLAGACWEDFELVSVGEDAWPKVSEAHGSVLQPVQLKSSKAKGSKDTSERRFIAKIKYQTPRSSKSCYDQDYSVCSLVEPHENIARVLAYFRGDIQARQLGLGSAPSHYHTTISITDQVPVMTCEEFIGQSQATHDNDPDGYERTVCLLTLQCLLGLDHLHNSGYAHGSITPANLYLIKHSRDYQLYLGNLGNSQPLPKERRGTETRKAKPENAPSGVRSDLTAVSELITTMLHSSGTVDDNGNVSKCRTTRLFPHLRKASQRLREASVSLRDTIGLLRTLLWGPRKHDVDVEFLSERRVAQWLERQRAEFLARLAMDEAMARSVESDARLRFTMEDMLLCEYLCAAK